MRKSDGGAVPLSPWGTEALMRRHVMLGGVTLAAAMALSNCTDKVGIQVSERFAATLSGANERPTAVTTTATGTASFTYLSDIGSIFYRLDVAGVAPRFAPPIHPPARTGAAPGVRPHLFTSPPTKPGLTRTGARGGFGLGGAPARPKIDWL